MIEYQWQSQRKNDVYKYNHADQLAAARYIHVNWQSQRRKTIYEFISREMILYDGDS